MAPRLSSIKDTLKKKYELMFQVLLDLTCWFTGKFLLIFLICNDKLINKSMRIKMIKTFPEYF